MFGKKFDKTDKNHELKQPNEFHFDVMKVFSVRANTKGYLHGASPFVPEIMEKGNEYTLEWLRNTVFAKQCNNDAITLYYNIATLSFFGGAYYAYIWDKDFQAFKESDIAGNLYRNDVLKVASKIMPIEKDEATNFCTSLFEDFFEMLQPYHRSLSNYAPYIQVGMLAFFQLGAGVQLQSMGYK